MPKDRSQERVFSETQEAFLREHQGHEIEGVKPHDCEAKFICKTCETELE